MVFKAFYCKVFGVIVRFHAFLGALKGLFYKVFQAFQGIMVCFWPRIEGLERIGAEYLASLRYIQLHARNLSGIYTAVDEIVK